MLLETQLCNIVGHYIIRLTGMRTLVLWLICSFNRTQKHMHVKFGVKVLLLSYYVDF